MFRRTIMRSGALGLLFILAWAPIVLAGGFQLEVETPEPANNAYPKGTALLVRTYGCHQPSAASLTATAEGVVKGERRSLPLELKETGKGVYAISQQWPAEGRWVLAINGTYNGMESSALVLVGSGGKVRIERQVTSGLRKSPSVKISHRKLTTQDIDAALGIMTGQETKNAITSTLNIDGNGFSVGAGFGVAALGLFAWRFFSLGG